MKKFLAFLRRAFSAPVALIPAANIAEGTHEGGISKLADAAITTRYLLVTRGTDDDHIAAVTAITDEPLGVCEDEPAAAEDPVNVQLLGLSARTMKMVAGEAIASINTRLYMGATGKVMKESGTPATYWFVGKNLTVAGADGDVIEVIPAFPTQFIVS
jgi:hypothetical protein